MFVIFDLLHTSGVILEILRHYLIILVTCQIKSNKN